MTEVTPELVRMKLSQLNLVLSPEIDYQLETMFPKLDGLFLNRTIRKKFQLVKQIEPILQEILLKHEQVLFTSKGKTDYHKTIVVLTNLRLLCMQTNDKGVPSQPFWSIYYTQIVDLNSIDSFIPKIRLKDGGKMSTQGFQKSDREMIVSVSMNADKVLVEKGIDPPVSQSRENLCGNCFEVVPKHEYECHACGATFWEPFEVGIRSFILPSWGNIAMKNYRVITAEVISLVCVWIGILSAVFNEDFVIAGLVLISTNISDATITFNNAAKGLYLKSVPETIKPEISVESSRY